MNLASAIIKRIKRWPMRRAIENLVQWKPLEDPQDGYTIIIAAMQSLSGVAAANLASLLQANLARAREIILVFDCLESEIPESIRSLVAGTDTIPIRLIGYSEKQKATAREINWGWVYSWMSWSIAIGACRTRHAVLHDLDAICADPDLFENLYTGFLDSNTSFHGIRWYAGNGIEAADGYVTTFEMFFDTAVMRDGFRPIEGFNKIGKTRSGRWVDFDTFLYIQSRVASGAVREVDEDALIHPSQLICHYTDAAQRPGRLPKNNSLPLMPLLLHLGGEPQSITSSLDALEQQPGSRTLVINGIKVDLSGMTPEHWAWMAKQARRLVELFRAQHPRGPGDAYLARLEAFSQPESRV
ncbi:hypothetical protein [Mucisphaera calidilacus]|uniref:Uncharacterized protein n=1 Tax=Mucisphaera calidilacus TaxID=2527982 RepID=A0A518BZE7_9BACT|nr:hypothetical protein [Mucisphaera calidilacus]QDU72353.1 hypothetical protein Pan265_22180 [Mucisphaera calidilacus]